MVDFADDPFEYVALIVCISAILMIPLGPLLFPHFWILLLSAYFLTFLGTQFNHLYTFWLTYNKIKDTISPDDKLDDVEKTFINETDLIHAFVIPNYSEPEALLRDTIGRIALHRKAMTNYVIILAMEASESQNRTKSENLKEQFNDKFLDFIITYHPSDLPGEARGKGSNISYAARKGCAEMVMGGMDRRKIIITIADSDSHIPELYITEVEKAFNESKDPYYRVFAPPIFFGRNCLKIPAAVRMTDITWSSMIMANLSSSRGLGFPCSTYSISLLLADRVGYWDTDADAVGEDMHMVLKCFFKTKGFARMTPIFVPINLTNVESKGYLENLGARFVQAKRHYNGVADVAFVLRHAFNLPTFCIDANTFCLPGTEKAVEEMAEEEECPFFWFDKMTMVLKVLETHFMPVTSGWLMFFAVPVMQIMYFPPQGYPTLIDPSNNLLLHSEVYMWIWNILKFTTLILPLPLFGTLGIYEKLHRFIDTEFLNKSKDETRTWKNYFDYFSMPIAAWLLMLLPSNIASCKRIFKSRDEYIVAEKMEYRE